MGDVLLTFTQLAFVAAVLTAALEVIFESNLFQKYLGKGLDGTGSKFFTTFELRPWIAVALGVAISWQFELCAIVEGLNINLTDFAGLKGPGGLSQALALDKTLTGIIIGGGTKSIKALAKNYATARKELKDTLA